MWEGGRASVPSLPPLHASPHLRSKKIAPLAFSVRAPCCLTVTHSVPGPALRGCPPPRCASLKREVPEALPPPGLIASPLSRAGLTLLPVRLLSLLLPWHAMWFLRACVNAGRIGWRGGDERALHGRGVRWSRARINSPGVKVILMTSPLIGIIYSASKHSGC